MPRPYFTLCVFDAEHGAWFDEFGDYCRADVQAECDDHPAPRKYKRIIRHDGSTEAMIAARNALPLPATKAKKG